MRSVRKTWSTWWEFVTMIVYCVKETLWNKRWMNAPNEQSEWMNEWLTDCSYLAYSCDQKIALWAYGDLQRCSASVAAGTSFWSSFTFHASTRRRTDTHGPCLKTHTPQFSHWGKFNCNIFVMNIKIVWKAKENVHHNNLFIAPTKQMNGERMANGWCWIGNWNEHAVVILWPLCFWPRSLELAAI